MFKPLAFITAILAFGIVAHAQPPAGISPQQMQMLQKFQNMSPEEIQAEAQKMQKQMARVGECMQDIDQNEMNALQERGNALSAKIKSLCQAGDEKAAEKYAMNEGQKFMTDPTIKKLKKCSKDMVKQFDFTPQTKAGKSKSICEE